MSFDTPLESLSSSQSGKKSYRTPKVLEYGTLRDITMVQGRNGSNDNGVGNGNDHSRP